MDFITRSIFNLNNHLIKISVHNIACKNMHYSISKLPQEGLPRNSKVRITDCTPYDLRIAEGQ